MPGPTDFVTDPRAVPLRLLAGAAHYDAVVGAMRGARRSLWIATANLKQVMIEHQGARPGRARAPRAGAAAARPARRDFESVLLLFEELVARGVRIRLLHAAPPSRPLAADLRRHRGLLDPPAGIPGRFELRQCPRVHFKVIVVDGALAYLGSANFTGAGIGAKGEHRRNFELGLLSDDDLLLDHAQALFDHVWQGAACGACRLRAECPAPLDGGPRPARPAARAPARRAGRRPARPAPAED